jgi:hypothetical protein
MRLKDLTIIDARQGKVHDTSNYRYKTFSDINSAWNYHITNELTCTQSLNYSFRPALRQVKKLYASHEKIGRKVNRHFKPIALRFDNYAVTLLVASN